MNLSSYLTQRMLRLDPPLTRDLVIERDLRVPMPDGAQNSGSDRCCPGLSWASARQPVSGNKARGATSET
ncbi:MAG: CocE/NonD family hydrolase, partial [Gemmatimonadales bacterium]